MKKYFLAFRAVIKDRVIIKNFHASIKSLRKASAPKHKIYRVKITKDQMGLLYALASQGINNEKEYIEFMETIKKPMDELRLILECSKPNEIFEMFEIK